ncbi:MAG: endonuclease [Bacteroidaceae bacterium]|nr:endonuclease [Bacteroidaceae bacterium]
MRRHTTLFLLSILLPYLAVAGIPDGYYDNANGKKKEALKAALHDIIQPVTVLAYGSGAGKTWSGFYKTDRTSNNQVIDRYSYDIRYFTNSTDAVSGMNIEHSFPKSWWGGSSTPKAYQDLFNLMPCEQKINSTKSNYAMGKVTGTDKGNGCTKVGTGSAGGKSTSLWEPADEWKGDFARDYFYMVTAYSHLTWTSNGLDMLEQDDWPTLQEWAYTLFLEWAKNDPVDDIERARNDSVYKIQLNRNPFVDFPNLAEYIWGDSVDFAFNVESSGGGGQGGDTPVFATLVNSSMKAGLDPFFVRTYEGCDGEAWTSDATYGAKATAFNLPNKEADEYLMVTLDLSMMYGAVMNFQHATGYNKTVPVKDTYFQVLVSYDYEGVPEDATWRMLDAEFPPLPSSGSNFSKFVSSGDISLAECCGRDNVTIAFRYISNSSACYCWEIKDVKITAYEVPDALPLIAEEDNGQQTTDNGLTYDLTGRQVPWNTKGLVIRNGKKILQK